MEESLKNLGFSNKEIQVFLSILKFGKTTPALIAKETGISRSTVYSVSKTLIRRGVITKDLGGKTLYLVALPLTELHVILDKEKSEIRRKEKLIKQAIQELSPIVAKSTFSIPKIRFIDGYEIKDFLYKQVKTWNDSTVSVNESWWGFQDHTFVEQYEDYIHHIWDKVHPFGSVKLLSNSSQIEKHLTGKYPGREIRFSPNLTGFTATIWIAGEYMIMITTNRKPNYLIEIKDAVLSKNMRELFKHLWFIS